MPSPAATAHALRCGTPGHGSGRRSRHTPGSTRSPRPSSRLRRAVAMRPLACQTSDRGRVEMAITRQKATSAEEAARGYFGALEEMDRQAQRTWYHDDSGAIFQGGATLSSKADVGAYFDALYNAIPDFKLEIVDIVAQGEKAAVQWHATGTFAGPGQFQGLDPTGGRIDLTGCDVVRARDGKVAWID